MADLAKLEEQLAKQKTKVDKEKQKLNQIEMLIKKEQSQKMVGLSDKYDCHSVEELEQALKEWHEKYKKEKEKADED